MKTLILPMKHGQIDKTVYPIWVFENTPITQKFRVLKRQVIG